MTQADAVIADISVTAGEAPTSTTSLVVNFRDLLRYPFWIVVPVGVPFKLAVMLGVGEVVPDIALPSKRILPEPPAPPKVEPPEPPLAVTKLEPRVMLE